VPVLAVASSGTAAPWMPQTAEAVVAAVPHGRFVPPEGGFHEVAAPVLAPGLTAFYDGVTTRA
jgi:hypothetical protein